MKKYFSGVLLSLLLLPQIAFGAYSFSQGGTNNTGPYASSTAIVSDGTKFYGIPFTFIQNQNRDWFISNGYLTPTTTITALLPAGFVSTASSTVETSLTLGYLTNGITKVVNGLISLATPDVDYQVPLTFGDGLTRTLDDVDCDTASASAFGCLTSADWISFNNKVSTSSLNSVWALPGLGSIGSSTATTTAEGNFSISGDLRVIGRTFLTDLYVVTEVFYNGLTGPRFTATSTTLASSFPLASSTAISIHPSTGQAGLVVRPVNGATGNLVDVENQFGTDLFVVTAAGNVEQNTLMVFNSGATINQIGGFLADTNSVTTLQSGLTTRAATTFQTPYNSATPSVIFGKNTSDDTGNIYRAGALYYDWVSAVTASRTGKLRLTLNDFNGERDVLTATSTGSASTLAVGLAINGGLVGIGTGTPALALEVKTGANGYPATSGTTQTGLMRLGGATNNVLDMGAAGVSPFGTWLQTTDRSNLATEYPLLLNPNGGNVGVGTTSPDYLLTLGNGGGTDNNKIAIDSAANRQSSIAFRSAGVDRWFIGRGDSDVLPVTTFFIGNTSGGTNNDPGGASAKLVIDSSGFVGISTSTPGTLLSLGNTGASTINITPSATSTFGFGLNISSGCYAIGGSCLTGPSQFVTVSSGVRNISGDIIATTDLVAMGGDLNAATSTTPFPISICKGANASSNALSACATSISKGGSTNSGAGAGTAGNGANVDIGGGGSNNRGTGNGGNAGNLDIGKGGDGPDGYGNDGIVTIGLAAASSGKANAGLILNGNATTTGTFYLTGLPTVTSGVTGTLCKDTNNRVTFNNSTTCLLSSIRYKHDVKDIDIGLNEIKQLRSVVYKFNGTEEERVGFIAEEVYKIDPRLVDLDAEGKPLTVRYQELTAVLVKAIQEQDRTNYWPYLGLLGLLGLIPRRKK